MRDGRADDSEVVLLPVMWVVEDLSGEYSDLRILWPPPKSYICARHGGKEKNQNSCWNKAHNPVEKADLQMTSGQAVG
jgi:hypothetical protein